MFPRETDLGRGRPHGDFGVRANTTLSLLQGPTEADPTPPHPHASRDPGGSPHPDPGWAEGIWQDCGPSFPAPPLQVPLQDFYLNVGGEGGERALGVAQVKDSKLIKRNPHSEKQIGDPRRAFKTPFQSKKKNL